MKRKTACDIESDPSFGVKKICDSSRPSLVEKSIDVDSKKESFDDSENHDCENHDSKLQSLQKPWLSRESDGKIYWPDTFLRDIVSSSGVVSIFQECFTQMENKVSRLPPLPTGCVEIIVSYAVTNQIIRDDLRSEQARSSHLMHILQIFDHVLSADDIAKAQNDPSLDPPCKDEDCWHCLFCLQTCGADMPDLGTTCTDTFHWICDECLKITYITIPESLVDKKRENNLSKSYKSLKSSAIFLESVEYDQNTNLFHSKSSLYHYIHNSDGTMQNGLCPFCDFLPKTDPLKYTSSLISLIKKEPRFKRKFMI